MTGLFRRNYSRTLDPDEMIMLARFEDEIAAWVAAECSAYRAWYAQLVRSADVGPIVSQYIQTQ